MHSLLNSSHPRSRIGDAASDRCQFEYHSFLDTGGHSLLSTYIQYFKERRFNSYPALVLRSSHLPSSLVNSTLTHTVSRNTGVPIAMQTAIAALIATIMSFVMYAYIKSPGKRAVGLPPGPPTVPFLGNMPIFPKSFAWLKSVRSLYYLCLRPID